MRNNEERSGARETAEAPPPQTQMANPLSFVVPTEFVDLPTKGKFYPENHPLHNVEEIEIKFMTAKEEDILTSRSLLKKGVAIDKMLQNLVVDKSIDVESLFIGDRNAILVAARSSGYGPEYKTSITCPACATVQTYKFDLGEAELSGFLENPQVLIDIGGVYDEESGTFLLTLPKTKVVVSAKLLTGRDEKKLARGSGSKKNSKTQENTMTDQFKAFVVAVNDEEDRQVVNNFIDTLPVMDSRDLRTQYANIVPNIDLSQEFVCNSCDYEQEMEVPFTVDFFWPRR